MNSKDIFLRSPTHEVPPALVVLDFGVELFLASRVDAVLQPFWLKSRSSGCASMPNQAELEMLPVPLLALLAQVWAEIVLSVSKGPPSSHGLEVAPSAVISKQVSGLFPVGWSGQKVALPH